MLEFNTESSNKLQMENPKDFLSEKIDVMAINSEPESMSFAPTVLKKGLITPDSPRDIKNFESKGSSTIHKEEKSVEKLSVQMLFRSISAREFQLKCAEVSNKPSEAAEFIKVR